jgi:uncharacterized protein (TIGR03382 family)
MIQALKSRLDRHFVACSAAAAAATVGGVAQQSAEATIIYSGAVNINIPSTTAGVYLNVAPAGVPGWDVNPWNGTGLGLFSPTAPAGGVYVVTAPNFGANLAPGTLISAASLFGSGSSANNAQWNLNSSNNLVGFRFQNEANANQTHYGWMRISLSATAGSQPRAIVEYAYEDVAGVGINAGAVPTPGTLALLGLGAAGLLRRRRA